ncbi:hypothetical protein [Lysinibacillus xylanilyticus]|nr:hypothetical protein [Lysinibacillus xylanilyticus]
MHSPFLTFCDGYILLLSAILFSGESEASATIIFVAKAQSVVL